MRAVGLERGSRSEGAIGAEVIHIKGGRVGSEEKRLRGEDMDHRSRIDGRTTLEIPGTVSDKNFSKTA